MQSHVQNINTLKLVGRSNTGWQLRRNEGGRHRATVLSRTGARPERLSLLLEHAGSAALALIPSSASLLDAGASCLSSSGSLATPLAGPSAAKAALPRRRVSPCAAAPSKRPGAGELISITRLVRHQDSSYDNVQFS